MVIGEEMSSFKPMSKLPKGDIVVKIARHLQMTELQSVNARAQHDIHRALLKLFLPHFPFVDARVVL